MLHQQAVYLNKAVDIFCLDQPRQFEFQMNR